MKKISFKVQKEFCLECELAIRRFIPKIKGIKSIDINDWKVEIDFDDSIITEEEVLQITKDAINRLGYKVLDRFS